MSCKPMPRWAAMPDIVSPGFTVTFMVRSSREAGTNASLPQQDTCSPPRALPPRRFARLRDQHAAQRARAHSRTPAARHRIVQPLGSFAMGGSGELAHYLLRADPAVEVLRLHQAQLHRRLLEGGALLVGGLGDLGRVVVADVRVERGDQH